MLSYYRYTGTWVLAEKWKQMKSLKITKSVQIENIIGHKNDMKYNEKLSMELFNVFDNVPIEYYRMSQCSDH